VLRVRLFRIARRCEGGTRIESAEPAAVLIVRALHLHLRDVVAQTGQPVHVVSERLGHSKVSMTMEVYAHVLPDMQQDAAAKLGALHR
jgi:integrase